MVWPCNTMTTKISPSASPKIVAMTFPTEGVTFNFFFFQDVGWCHSSDWLLVCSSRWWIHISSPMTTLKKAFTTSLIMGGGNLNSPLSTQFCDSQSGFMEPKKPSHMNILQHQLCCSHSEIHWFSMKYRKVLQNFMGNPHIFYKKCHLNNTFSCTWKQQLQS